MLALPLLLILVVTPDEFAAAFTTQTPNQQQILPYELENIAQNQQKCSELDKKIEKLRETLENHQTNTNEIYAEIKERLQSIEQKISQSLIPRNCKEVQERGNNVSGIYRIQPDSASKSFMVLCDMKTKGGGWTYILNRFDGSQNFYLNWTDYKEGFGNLGSEFWLGLEKLYLLTGYEPNELLVELVDWNSTEAYAMYSTFGIGSEDEGYYIKLVQGYSGDAGDSFSGHVGMKFTTSDKDQDTSENWNCANDFEGGWWYSKCGFSDLSGRYQEGAVPDENTSVMFWGEFRGYLYSLKQARMMIKPRDKTSSPLLPHETAP